jgi:hypothetical protein
MQPEIQEAANLPEKAFIKLVDVPLVTHKSRVRCGSYTTEWIARAVGLHPIPSNKILGGPMWFDLFRPVFPRDIKVLFKYRGMDSQEFDLSKKSDQQKLDWVRREVATNGKPIALLVRKGLLHWIAVCGYDNKSKVFYIYDSLHGDSSMNPFFPLGNNSIRYEELINIWKGRWWMKYRAIVVSVPK